MSEEKDNYGEWEVIVHISEIINNDLEGFLDLLSELAVESTSLMDINFTIVGVGKEPNTLKIKVTGDNSEVEDEKAVRVGQRIEMVLMENDPDPIQPGTKGTVLGVGPTPVKGEIQINVKWDNGRSLSILYPEDKFKIIDN